METTAGDHPSRISVEVVDYPALEADLKGFFEWMNKSTRDLLAEANRITNA